jgi:hypothetical protein
MPHRYKPNPFASPAPHTPPGRVVTPEIAAFCTSGVSIVIGTLGPDRRAVTGRALACVTDGLGIRLLFDTDGNDALMAAMAASAPIAATFSEPLTHRSLQLKAARGESVPPAPGDLEEMARQSRHFTAILETIGYSHAFAAAYCRLDPAQVRACAFVPTAAFEQTPGPAAGRAL